jgi:hypothetical protein
VKETDETHAHARRDDQSRRCGVGAEYRDSTTWRSGSTASPTSISGAAVLVFRDADNIQLEVFFDPSEES